MKGQLISGAIQYTLNVQGESWFQGQKVKGQLTVKNQGTAALPLQEIGVTLAYGKFKEVHQNAEDAFDDIDQVVFPSALECAPQGEQTLAFEFSPGINSPITDKKGSYFLCYGQKDQGSHLQLLISPRPLFKQISGLWESFFRFKFKEVKAQGEDTLYKYTPPESKEMAHVDSLDMSLSMDKDILEMNLVFQVKKFDTSSVLSKVTKAKKQYPFKLTPREYSLALDDINQDKFLEIMGEVMKQVKIKF